MGNASLELVQARHLPPLRPRRGSLDGRRGGERPSRIDLDTHPSLLVLYHIRAPFLA